MTACPNINTTTDNNDNKSVILYSNSNKVRPPIFNEQLLKALCPNCQRFNSCITKFDLYDLLKKDSILSFEQQQVA